MLRSTFAGFTMAQHALLANQRALDVAGQNLSNINTEGYTRQRLDLASISPTGASYTTSEQDNKVGQGVMMTGITQIRDPFLDIQYRNQVAKVGTVDATDVVLERLGNMFDETDSTAIRAAFNDVITQLNNLASSATAGEESMDAIVRSSFESLLNLFNQNALELKGLEEEIVYKMEESLIPNLNTAMEQIAQLNVTIKNTQVLGNPAHELTDQRNMLLDEIASYLPIDVSYRDISGEPKIDELVVTFTATDGNTYTLLDDIDYASFAFNEAGATEHPYLLTLTPAHVDKTQPAPTAVDITNTMENGVLKGYTDMLNSGEVFDGTDTRGIPYYEQFFDSFVNELATMMNEMNQTVDPAGNVIDNILFETNDGSPEITALNIQVSDAWKQGLVELSKSKDVDATGEPLLSTDYENILDMVRALTTEQSIYTTTDTMGNTVTIFSGTMQSMYDNLQNVQAIDRKASSTLLQNHVTVLNQISDTKDSVSSVNQDEEVADLMRYQQSYSAASRLMTTMDEILDVLINNTGIVGR